MKRTWKDIDLEYRKIMTEYSYSAENKNRIDNTPIPAKKYYEDVAILLKTLHSVKNYIFEDKIEEYINNIYDTHPEYFNDNMSNVNYPPPIEVGVFLHFMINRS